ncbi:MAG: hypothetical protein QOJ74_278 [Ilumatobacteraceae bacterium]|jgi:hypothetical protein|nr:hypothetical protein [Ilumatobacteraceae bacterium]
MADETRRERLLALKLGALVREHWTTDDLQTTPFALGSAARDGTTGWVLLEERQHRGLGPALAWAVRAGVDRLHVLAEEGTGTLARRSTAFRMPIEVWHVAERVLLPAIAESLPEHTAAPHGHDELSALITQGGATPVVEHGVLIGEVRGLEVCRVVTDEFGGEPRLEVGIGQHDREAFRMLHGDVPSVDALAKVVAAVEPHRRRDAAPHPLNRLGRERALLATLIDEPVLIGASRIESIPSPIVRASVKDPHPAVARAIIDGVATTVVVSAGVDLDVVPFATDARLSTGEPTWIVVPPRDALPVQGEIAALLRQPIPIVPVG